MPFTPDDIVDLGPDLLEPFEKLLRALKADSDGGKKVTKAEVWDIIKTLAGLIPKLMAEIAD